MSNPKKPKHPSDNESDENNPEYPNKEFEIDPQILAEIDAHMRRLGFNGNLDEFSIPDEQFKRIDEELKHIMIEQGASYQEIEKITYPNDPSEEEVILRLQKSINSLEEYLSSVKKPIDYSKSFNEIVFFSTLSKNFELCGKGKGEYMIDLAFKEVAKIKEPYWKVKSFTAIYTSLCTFDPAKAKLVLDEAFLTFKQICDPILKAKSASDIAVALANTDQNDSLKWAEEAIHIAECINDQCLIQNAVYNVINNVAKICPNSSWNAFLRIDNHPDTKELYIRNKALLSIAIEFSRKYPFKALEQATLIGEQYMKDEVLACIAVSLSHSNRKKALALVEEIQDSIWNSKALYKITTALFTIKPNTAYELLVKIKDPYWKNKTLLNFANKLFIMKYSSWRKTAMLSLSNALKMPDFLSKAKSLSEFSVLISRSSNSFKVARVAARFALKIAKLIKDPYSKTVALLDVLKAISFLNLEERADVDNLLHDNAAKLDDDLKRNQALVLISTWLFEQKKINNERIEMYAKYEADKAFKEEELNIIFDDFEIQKVLETFRV